MNTIGHLCKWMAIDENKYQLSEHLWPSLSLPEDRFRSTGDSWFRNITLSEDKADIRDGNICRCISIITLRDRPLIGWQFCYSSAWRPGLTWSAVFCLCLDDGYHHVWIWECMGMVCIEICISIYRDMQRDMIRIEIYISYPYIGESQ